MYTHVKCLHKSDSIENIIPANLQTPQHVFWSGCDKDVDMDEVWWRVIHICICNYIIIYNCVYIYIWMCIYTYIHIYIYLYDVYLYICIYIYIWMYIVHIYIYIHHIHINMLTVCVWSVKSYVYRLALYCRYAHILVYSLHIQHLYGMYQNSIWYIY